MSKRQTIEDFQKILEGKEKAGGKICNEDCLNCIYEDCINDNVLNDNTDRFIFDNAQIRRKEYARRYREKHREELREKNRIYRLEHKDKIREYKKKYAEMYKNDPEYRRYVLDQHAAWRQRKKEGGAPTPSVPPFENIHRQ